MSVKILSSGPRRTLSLAILAALAMTVPAQHTPPAALHPAGMPKLGTVDPRYLSYNVEMVEVTGGRFWKPYGPGGAAPKLDAAGESNQQVGVNPNLYGYRPPIDLSNARLRKLAAALGPAYVRVSGSWQNSTYFQDDDNPPLAQPPAGFRSILTRAEWKGVVNFARAADAEIVTSAAISPGTRDAAGVWTPAQAHALFDYTKSLGSGIAAAEFMNEPTFPGPGGAPDGYDAAAFARDAKLFGAFLRAESPGTIFLGPGSVGEGISLVAPGSKVRMLRSEDMLKAAGPIFDAFSYHFYGAVSRRCGGTITLEQALSAGWLDRANTVEAFYSALRDAYLPGKPMWVTETAEAGCGGDPFAAQFADTFRFANQLGTLAQKSVQVVMHNTLASSEYGLLDQRTFEPRPDYWVALLWKRLMGDVVLDPGAPAGQPLRIYAHCLLSDEQRNTESTGGVALLALNTDATGEQSIQVPLAGERYTLTAPSLASTTVLLNGHELRAGSDGSIPMPALRGQRVPAGILHLPPASITFLAFFSAGNQACTW